MCMCTLSYLSSSLSLSCRLCSSPRESSGRQVHRGQRLRRQLHTSLSLVVIPLHSKNTKQCCHSVFILNMPQITHSWTVRIILSPPPTQHHSHYHFQFYPIRNFSSDKQSITLGLFVRQGGRELTVAHVPSHFVLCDHHIVGNGRLLVRTLAPLRHIRQLLRTLITANWINSFICSWNCLPVAISRPR